MRGCGTRIGIEHRPAGAGERPEDTAPGRRTTEVAGRRFAAGVAAPTANPRATLRAGFGVAAAALALAGLGCSGGPPLVFEPSDCKGLPPALRAAGGLAPDLASAPPRGNGALRLEERDVAVFTVVCSALPVPVRLKAGAVQRVALRLDENLLSGVETRVEGGRLVLYASAGFVASPGAEVVVHVQELRSFTVAGAGRAELGGLHADRLRLQVDGVGSITAFGTADHLDLAVHGAGRLEAHGVTTTETRAIVDGVGAVTGSARERFDARVVGLGSIEVHGNPSSLDETVEGLGRVTRAAP